MPASRLQNALPSGTERDVTLDIFRAVAILLVILYHYTARLPVTAFGAAEPLALPIVFGWVGVYFFFILSGYCCSRWINLCRCRCCRNLIFGPLRLMA